MAMMGSMMSMGASVAGGIAQANAARAQAKYEENLALTQGKQQLASSQRQMVQQGQQGDMAMSKQLATAAASGGGVQTPSIMAIYGQTAGQTNLNARSALYTGQQEQWQQKVKAEAAKARGENAAQGSILSALGGAASGLGKMMGAGGGGGDLGGGMGALSFG
jgi:hypothetical protein